MRWHTSWERKGSMGGFYFFAEAATTGKGSFPQHPRYPALSTTRHQSIQPHASNARPAASRCGDRSLQSPADLRPQFPRRHDGTSQSEYGQFVGLITWPSVPAASVTSMASTGPRTRRDHGRSGRESSSTFRVVSLIFHFKSFFRWGLP